MAGRALLGMVGGALVVGVAAQEPTRSDRFAPGFYIGAELGALSYGNACEPTALSCEHGDSSAAAFSGYRFQSLFGLELGWRDLGDAHAIYPRLTSTNEVEGETDGYDLSALLHFPFGRAWEFYLRGGAFRWRAETRSPEFSTAESGWSPSAGGGFAWQFRPAWQLRFESVYLSDVGGTDTGRADVATLSAGVSYVFGQRARAATGLGAAAIADDDGRVSP